MTAAEIGHGHVQTGEDDDEDERPSLDKGCREFYLGSGETIIQEEEHEEHPR